MRKVLCVIAVVSMLALGLSIFGQQAAPVPKDKPKVAQLLFKEDFKPGAEHEVQFTPDLLTNPNLELKLIGPTGKEILMTGAATNENNPTHLWTGMCTSPCGFTLRDKNNFADLTGLARIKFVTKVSGYHLVRPIVKLADGTMLVSDQAEGSTVDWLTSDLAVSEMRWRKLDPARLVTVGDWVASPNLSRIDEIGFVDLIPGSGHGQGGWSDVAQIEIYAKSVKREGSTNQ